MTFLARVLDVLRDRTEPHARTSECRASLTLYPPARTRVDRIDKAPRATAIAGAHDQEEGS